ncbi:Nitrate/nitrite transporter [Rubrobacter radiotolerans]|uniref:MFS transporter n=1 Tax=Rubrobacter radiotolerans TaxID=42256 RepID=A0A023X1G4_RUBRA|nr:MFS transporter [Rubrobacter radiotolerans]AHY45855.1 Nitrate/nitrite transporter [Rubrobacter radiotolerans]MDX5893269.1 MFS transporter [Rubrobacter radiotolerans]SMC03393.1 MFS transporter, NNP family, nitrate/nitrite transporter [Rubrobacter radiotolerans DSM 5868]
MSGAAVETRRGAYRALVLATLAFALCFSVWGLIAPLAPSFQELYQLSGTQISLVIATPVILGSLFRIPLGLLTDRFGGRLVFTLLMLFLTLPALAIGFLGGSFGGLLFWGFLIGLAGASFAVGVPYVSGWFPPERQGLALGIYGMGNIGTAVAAYSAPAIAAALGWQWAFWAFVLPLVVFAGIFWTLGRDAPRSGPRLPVTEGMKVFKDEVMPWVLALFYFLTFGGFVALGIYLPQLLVDVFSLETTDAGARAAGFVVLATLARPAGGWISDRVGGSRTLLVVFAGLPILALVLATTPGMVLFTIAALTIALLLGVGNGAVFKLVAEHYPGKTGAVTGVVGAAGGLGGFFPPIVMGIVRDATGGYGIGFALLALFALGCLIVNIFVMRQRNASQTKGA